MDEKSQFLNIDSELSFKLPLQAMIGESVAVLGIKGSGKTNTTAVIIEELLSHGLPLTIVDIEGEYWGLKERYEILVVGRSNNVDLEVGVNHAAKIAEFSVIHSVSVILDLSDFTQDEMFNFLLQYFKSLWAICFKMRKPYEIVLEEAHEFVPQSVRTPLKEVLTRIALRGRKRGLGIISVSQRSAKVEKDVLTQAAIVFLHRVVHPIDIKVYQDILPLPPREVEYLIGELDPGRVISLYMHQVKLMRVRLRYTFHVGATPELIPSAMPKLRKIDSNMMVELRSLIAKIGTVIDERSQLIKDLEEQVIQKDLQIQTLKTQMQRLELQVELLSKLQLSLDENSRSAISGPKTKLSDLEIEQIYAHQLITKEESSSIRVPQAVHILQEVLPIINQGNSRSLDGQVQRKQQQRFNYLVEDVKKLPKFHREILRFLIEREGTTMTIRELSRWLNLSESTIQNRPPLELIKMGLILRTGSRGNHKYSSALSALLKKEFPDLEPEAITQLLIAIC